jgi:hypothetical protein
MEETLHKLKNLRFSNYFFNASLIAKKNRQPKHQNSCVKMVLEKTFFYEVLWEQRSNQNWPYLV